MVYALIASQASFIRIRPFTKWLLGPAAVTTCFSFSDYVKDTDSSHPSFHGNTPSGGPAHRMVFKQLRQAGAIDVVQI